MSSIHVVVVVEVTVDIALLAGVDWQSKWPSRGEGGIRCLSPTTESRDFDDHVRDAPWWSNRGDHTETQSLHNSASIMVSYKAFPMGQQSSTGYQHTSPSNGMSAGWNGHNQWGLESLQLAMTAVSIRITVAKEVPSFLFLI